MVRCSFGGVFMDAKFVREILDYNQETGVFTWKVRRGGRANAGSIAGRVTKNKGKKSYIGISINGKRYLAHRLAFFVMKERWPDTIDHINGCGLDNRWSNLREISRSENSKNMKLNKLSKTGISGVSRFTRNHKPTWEAYIWSNNVKHRIGYYHDFFEACCARKSKENSLNYHKNHGQIRPLYEFCDDVMQAIWSL